MAASIHPAEAQPPLAPAPWSVPTRIAFRFSILYFGLYCLSNQILTSLFVFQDTGFPDLDTLWPVRLAPQWAATHIFHIATPLSYAETGSGDRMFDWMVVFCLLILSALGTLAWSLLDRTRPGYSALSKWFRLVLRLALACQMLSYGFAKIIPVQMPFPFLTRLIEPYGNFSPMGVLWYSIGASPAYETFTGCAETLAGLLLLLPRTALLGALVCLMDMIQVFMLNMTYDVPVKLLSFHFILMALFLLAPELPRLASFFFSDRAIPPSSQPALFRSLRANRIALAAQLALGVWLIGLNLHTVLKYSKQIGTSRPKSALYGIWDIEQQSIDGQPQPLVVSDSARLRRAVFDFPERMSFQRMDSTFTGYSAAISADAKTLSLTKGDDKNWKAQFSYQREPQDHLVLDGEMDGHKMRFELRLVDHTKFLLVSRGFHWVNEFPFNR